MNDSSPQRYSLVTCARNLATAVAYPEKIPAVDVSVWRCGRFTGGVFSNVEVLRLFRLPWAEGGSDLETGLTCLTMAGLVA